MTTPATGSRLVAWSGARSPAAPRADAQTSVCAEARPEPAPEAARPGPAPLAALPGTSPAAQVLAAVLDAIDYGVLLVDHERVLHHVNRLGRGHLRRGDALRLDEGRLALSAAGATSALVQALRSAVERGLRTTLQLGPHLAMAVIPAAGLAPGVHSMAALLLSRHGLCTPLALDAFARQHGLTVAENAVLHALARDETPEDIAAAHGVALSTVRTQVVSIRAKTGTRSTRDLLSRLARVPPLVSVVCD